MKFIIRFVVLVGATMVNGLSNCILNCQHSAALKVDGCGSDYNSTSCYCGVKFQVATKNCMYGSGCSSESPTFFEHVDDFCDGKQESVQYDAGRTIADMNGPLGSCVLDCQAQAGLDECSTSDYNSTSCYCKRGFSKSVVSCLEHQCADYVSVFNNHRHAMCPHRNHLNRGQKAGISVGSVLGGIALFGTAIYLFLRRRRQASATKAAAEEAARVQMKEAETKSCSTFDLA